MPNAIPRHHAYTTLHECVDPTIVTIQYLKVYLIIMCTHVACGYFTIPATVNQCRLDNQL